MKHFWQRLMDKNTICEDQGPIPGLANAEYALEIILSYRTCKKIKIIEEFPDKICYLETIPIISESSPLPALTDSGVKHSF